MCPTCKGQTVREIRYCLTLENVPKRQYLTTNLCHVTSQKNKGLKSRINDCLWHSWVCALQIYCNIYPTRCNFTLFISGNCSTCFGCYVHPLSGAHTTVSTASVICHTVTAICRYRGRAGIHLQYFHDSSKGMTSTRCCRYICLRSLCWMKLTL